MSAETGECVKCRSEIPVDAERCRECGYEPGPGVLGGIVMWVSGMIGSVFITIALVSLLVIFTGFPVLDGLIVFAFTGGLGAVFGAIVYAGYRANQRGPTEKPFGAPDQSEQSSWQDGAERGEAAADRINDLGPAIVAALPSWTWTVGVLLGIVLHLSLWIATIQESEIGMSVGLLGGLTVSFAALVVDTHQVKWAESGYSPRWWFWALPGAVPLFGWIFGLVWLLRKRQKIGSLVG